MSTNEARSQGSTAIVIADDDAGVVDGTPDREGPFTKYDRYGESIGHSYVRCSVCGAEAPDGETPTALHRSACYYE